MLAGNPQFPIEAGWYVDGGAVVVTSRERAYARPVVTRVYDVSDLLLASARAARQPAIGEGMAAGSYVEALETLVESGRSRRVQGRRVQGRRVAYWGGRLFVVDTPDAQRAVAGELARLRGLIQPPAAGGR